MPYGNKYQTIPPENLWYAVGLIATDGNLSKDGRHINITSKDIAFLESVRDALQLKNKVGLKARSSDKVKKYGNLQFGDVALYKYLLTVGLTPTKSLTLGKLKIPDS